MLPYELYIPLILSVRKSRLTNLEIAISAD
jgi:hypothetical protein